MQIADSFSIPGDTGDVRGRAAVTLRRGGRDRDAVPGCSVCLGRREPVRLRLLRLRLVRLFARWVCRSRTMRASQFSAGSPVSREALEPGDLVFFNGLGHVGIYIGGGQFVHAPHTGDVVKVSSLSELLVRRDLRTALDSALIPAA